MDKNKYTEFAKQLKNILLPNGIFAYTEIKLPTNFILKHILLFYFRLIIPYFSLSFLNKQSGINYLHTYLQKFDGGTKLNTALLNEKMTLKQATSFWQIATIVIAKNK
jgi:ubiquinone/menaquinone biosynthesis C-methylase UbiE